MVLYHFISVRLNSFGTNIAIFNDSYSNIYTNVSSWSAVVIPDRGNIKAVSANILKYDIILWLSAYWKHYFFC